MSTENENNDLDDLKAQIAAIAERANKLENENKVLKAHADETIQEKRKLKAKMDEELQNKERALLDKSSRSQEENDQLVKQYQQKASDLENQIKSLKEKEYKNKLSSKALELAQKLAAKNPAKAELLADKIISRIKLEEDGAVRVLDDSGNITISPVDSLVNEFGTKYAFLCDGVESTGGGSHSSAPAPKKSFNEMSTQEKIDLYRESPEKYEQAKDNG